MSFLTGQAAVTAFKHDHPGAQEGPPNDYYIVNTTKDYLQLPLSANTKLLLVEVNGVPHTTPLAAPLSTLPHYPNLTNRPFVVSGINGTVTAITERFVP